VAGRIESEICTCTGIFGVSVSFRILLGFQAGAPIPFSSGDNLMRQFTLSGYLPWAELYTSIILTKQTLATQIETGSGMLAIHQAP
jgi:hypothetical protein